SMMALAIILGGSDSSVYAGRAKKCLPLCDDERGLGKAPVRDSCNFGMRHHRCIELDWQEEKNMTEQDFLTKMKNDVLITENDIDMDMKLENLVEWDSLGFVNFIALAKIETGRKVTRDMVESAVTVRDLYEMLK
ncbi:MAG: acyl carrier protein, partial [Selenomonas sp.]